jgi:protein-arginine kinase activator protein McsA
MKCSICNKNKRLFQLTSILSGSTSGKMIRTYICHDCIIKNNLSEDDIIGICESKLNFLDYSNIQIQK